MKKIILSVCILSLFVMVFNISCVEAASSYAATVKTENLLTYITAGDYNNSNLLNKVYGEAKKNFYKTNIGSSYDVAALNPLWLGKNSASNVYEGDLPSFYVKGIWGEKIGGSDAFCLDPGLSISQNGYTPEGTTEVKNFSSLGNEEKIYAMIYYANFKDLKVYYAKDAGSVSFTIGEEGDYIIKQILFWTYIAHPNFLGIGSRNCN